MIIRLQGIVLKNKAYGESDQLLYVFTQERGKLTLVVRGSKRPRSRFGAVTEPFTIASYVCYQHSPSSMPSLSQADILEHNKNIRADLLLTAYGAYWLELVDRVIVEKEPQPALYSQLVILLKQLNQGKDPEILTRLLELAVVKAAGYQPIFSHCIQCHKTDDFRSFSVSQGGFVCGNCSSPDTIPISSAAAHYLRILNEISAEQLGTVNIKQETKQELEIIVQRYLDTHLELQSKARVILQQLKDTWDDST